MPANPSSTSHPGHALRHMFNSEAMPGRSRYGYLFYRRCGLLYLNPADPEYGVWPKGVWQREPRTVRDLHQAHVRYVKEVDKINREADER
jgi:hypothetical protein